MLPSPLLRARSWKGRMIILFARGKPIEIELARVLIDTYQKHVGKKLGELSSSLDEIEEYYESLGVDYRLVRGLSILLERRCKFSKPETLIQPRRARKTVFELCNAKLGGFTTSQEERNSILNKAAWDLGISREELEESLWADLEENLNLIDFDEIEEERLLKLYNQSLLQTALFKALSLILRTRAPGRELKRVLREIKFRKLMYQAEKEDGFLILRIDGPASIMKMTTRYGTSLAKLIPSIIPLSHWEIEASVVRRSEGREKRVLRLLLGSKERDLFPRNESVLDRYDSQIERNFSKMVSALDWKVEREPEALLAGKALFFPDFKLEKGPLSVYVEVVGFWTSNYLQKKLKKISDVEERLILIVDKNLACSSFQKLPHPVFYYEGRIDFGSFARFLSRIEESSKKMVDKEIMERLVKVKLEDCVDIRKLAKEIDVTKDQLLNVLKQGIFKGYVVAGDVMIKEELLDRVRRIVETSGTKFFSEISKLMSNAGFREEFHLPLIQAAGYKLVWRSLDLSDAVIE